jgi:hypothetical protein
MAILLKRDYFLLMDQSTKIHWIRIGAGQPGVAALPVDVSGQPDL